MWISWNQFSHVLSFWKLLGTIFLSFDIIQNDSINKSDFDKAPKINIRWA